MGPGAGVNDFSGLLGRHLLGAGRLPSTRRLASPKGHSPPRPIISIRRFLSAVRTLALVRRLALPVLVAQVNVAQQANGRNGDAQPRWEARHPRGTLRACTCPADRRTLIGESV
jgi:hypothetical protein